MTGGRGCEDAVRGAGRSPGRRDVQEAEGRKRSGGKGWSPRHMHREAKGHEGTAR